MDTDILSLIQTNFLTPPILFFILGVAAGVVRSDLSIPESISRYLSLYLMMAIGFKGGAALAGAGIITAGMVYTTAAGVAGSFALPFLAYFLLSVTTRLDRATAAAVAAHYGSISIVTFATAAAFLDAQNIAYAGHIVAVLALMEAPAIISGLFIARGNTQKDGTRKLFRDIFTNGAVLLLLGSFAIGWVTGAPGMNAVKPFLVDPFQGVLCLFLLDMGLLVSRNIRHLRDFTFPLVAFGIYMPLAAAGIASAVSYGAGMDPSTSFLFMVLFASASYIAVPAAMRMALPEAKATVYLPMSLAITFPFNILVGIPLYFQLSKVLAG